MQGLLRSDSDPTATGHIPVIAAWNHSFTLSGVSPFRVCIGAYFHTFRTIATTFLRTRIRVSRGSVLGRNRKGRDPRSLFRQGVTDGGLPRSTMRPPNAVVNALG